MHYSRGEQEGCLCIIAVVETQSPNPSKPNPYSDRKVYKLEMEMKALKKEIEDTNGDLEDLYAELKDDKVVLEDLFAKLME